MMFEPEQEALYAESDWMPKIAKWIDENEPPARYDVGTKRNIPAGWAHAEPPGFTGIDVAQGCLGVNAAKDFRRAEQNEVRKCLKRLGCRQPPRQNSRRYWLPPEDSVTKPTVTQPNGQTYAGEDRHDAPF
jgi:hypothetical protein